MTVTIMLLINRWTMNVSHLNKQQQVSNLVLTLYIYTKTFFINFNTST